MANLVQATISGAHADLFEIVSGAIRPKPGAILDFEAQSSLSILVTAIYSDYSIVGYPITINLININEAPGQVFVVPNTVTVQEDRTAEMKLADITIADDALGTNQLSLSGSAGVTNLEIRGNQLWLKANPTLDFGTTPEISTVISAADPTLPDAAVTVSFLLRVSPAQNQAPVFNLGTYTAAIPTFTSVGTEIVTVEAVDPEGKAIAYSIIYSSHPGYFSVNSSTGVVTVIQSLLLLTQPVYLTIAAGDSGTPPQTSSTTVEIELLIPPPPSLFLGSIIVSSNGDTITLNSSMLDANLEGDGDDIVFTITSLTDVAFSVGGQAVTQFTTNQVAAGAVSLTYFGNGAGSFSVTATKWAKTSVPQTLSLTHKPWVTKADIGVTSFLQYYTLTSSDIQYIDYDSAPSLVTFTISNLSVNGSFRRIATVTPVSTFTAQDLIEKNIGISVTQSQSSGAISYSIQATDSTTLASQTLSDTIAIVNNIIPVSSFELTMTAGTSKILTSADAIASNDFTLPGDLVYIISQDVLYENITFQITTDLSTNVYTFTQSDINEGRVQITVLEEAFFFNSIIYSAYSVEAEGVTTGPLDVIVNIPPILVVDIEGIEASLLTPITLSSSFASIQNYSNSGGGVFSISNLSGGNFIKGGSNVTSFTATELNAGNLSILGLPVNAGKMAFNIQYTAQNGITSAIESVEIPGIVLFSFEGISLNPSGETKALLPGNIGASCFGFEDNFSFVLSELSSNISFVKNSAVTTSFTIADLNAGNVMLVYTGNGDPIVKVTATRGISSGFMYLGFAEVFLNYQPIALSSIGETITLTPSILSATLSGSSSGFTFYVSNLSSATVRKIIPNVSNTSVSSFTSQELLDGQIAFAYDGISAASATIRATKNSVEATDDLVFTYKPFLSIGFSSSIRVATNTSIALNTSNIVVNSRDGTTGLNYVVASVSGGVFRKSGATVTTFSHADLVGGLMTIIGSPTPSGMMTYSVYCTDAQGDQSNTVSGSIPGLISRTFDPVIVDATGQTIVATAAMFRCTQLGYQTGFAYEIATTNRVSFTLNGSPTTVFTSADLTSGTVSLTFNGLGVPSTALIIRRAGEVATEAVIYQTRPVITIASIETASSSGTLLSSSNLFCIDWTSSPTQLTWTVVSSSGCVFTRSNLEVTSFTQADINNSLVRLKSTVAAGGSGGSGGSLATFTLRVTDQEGLTSNQVSGSAQIV